MLIKVNFTKFRSNLGADGKVKFFSVKAEIGGALYFFLYKIGLPQMDWT